MQDAIRGRGGGGSCLTIKIRRPIVCLFSWACVYLILSKKETNQKAIARAIWWADGRPNVTGDISSIWKFSHFLCGNNIHLRVELGHIDLKSEYITTIRGLWCVWLWPYLVSLICIMTMVYIYIYIYTSPHYIGSSWYMQLDLFFFFFSLCFYFTFPPCLREFVTLAKGKKPGSWGSLYSIFDFRVCRVYTTRPLTGII